MKLAIAWIFAATFLAAVVPSTRAQSTASDPQPSITGIRGKMVTVRVPDGFDSVTLQVLRKPAGGTRVTPAQRPSWRTVDTQFPRRQSATLTFRLGKLTGARNLRVLGSRGAELPESYFAGATVFAPDLNGPLSGKVSTLLKSGQVSANGVTGDFEAGGGAPTREVVEADIWKIRGDRLLYFNQLRGLQVFDLQNPDDPALLGTLRLPASGEDLYVLDDTHAVLLKRSAGWWDGWWFGGGWGGLGVVTNIALADTSVRLAPSQLTGEQLRQNELIVAAYGQGTPTVLASLPFDGSLLESRLVGSVLYVATSISRETADGGWESGTQVVSFDLSDPAHPIERAKLFLPISGAVVSATDRVLLVVGYDWANGGSSVQVLDISSPDGAIAELGSVQVEGYVEDKFKLGVNGDILTVASQGYAHTVDPNGDAVDWGNPVTVLQTFSLSNLSAASPLGRVEIAPGETVRATRFDGTRAYVVTFKQIDPLHIIDLSDPAHLKVSGQVDVPGFSTYIEPLGDRLATIGLVNWRPTVSLFDVSDATAPKLLSQVKLGTSDSGWAESEAVWNEKAFKVIPDQNLILLPVAGFDLTNEDEWGGTWFSRVQIIDLFRNSLAKRGIIEANFSPRRADLYHDRILAISPSKLVAVDAQDRDAPRITAEVDIAWRTDHVWRVSDFLVQLGGSAGWNPIDAPTITASPRLEPDHALSVTELGNLPVVGSTLHDGVLYVAQRAWIGWQIDAPEPVSTDDQRLLVSAYDVSALPQVKLLSKTSSAVPVDGWSELNALWPSPGTLVWVAESFWHSWYRQDGTYSSKTGISGSADGVSYIPARVPWLGGWTKKLIAFDVSTPEKISFGSVVDFDGEIRGLFSDVFAADGLVYFSVFSPGEGWIDEKNARLDDPMGNRHELSVVEYRDARSPFVRDERVAIPGELRGIGMGGKLLYTLGPATDPAAVDSREVQVSAFDGLAAHLIDSKQVDGENNSIEASGDDLFVLEEQPAYSYGYGPGVPVVTAGPAVSSIGDALIFYRPTPNPLKSELHRLRLDGGKLLSLSDKELDHDAGLHLFGNLLVTQTADHGARLLDISNPADISELQQVSFTGWIWPNLDGADGALGDGLFIPLGDYGIETIDLTPAPQ